MAINKKTRRDRIKKTIRRKITGTAQRPRLTIFRSNQGVFAQIIDDEKSATLASASWLEFKEENLSKTELSKKVGAGVAEKAKEKGIEKVVFDRNGYLYHGRVKVLADAAREAGLKF